VNQRQKVSLTVVLLAMIYILLVVLFDDNGWFELRRLEQTRQQLVKGNMRLTNDNLQMYRSVDRLVNDPVFVENIARQELGMIRPDELIFTFKSEATQP
jgi:cell division protein FtsB